MTEPEEIVESKLVALLEAAAGDVPVVGMLTPAPDGVEKAAPDTCILVCVDFGGQLNDWQDADCPCTYSVRVTVRVAADEDKTGAIFRDICRNVRGVLASLVGDGCATLDGDGIECNKFTLGQTESSADVSADVGIIAKIYNATMTAQTNQTEN